MCACRGVRVGGGPRQIGDGGNVRVRIAPIPFGFGIALADAKLQVP